MDCFAHSFGCQPGELLASLVTTFRITNVHGSLVVTMLLIYSVLHYLYSIGNKITTITATTTTTITTTITITITITISISMSMAMSMSIAIAIAIAIVIVIAIAIAIAIAITITITIAITVTTTSLISQWNCKSIHQVFDHYHYQYQYHYYYEYFSDFTMKLQKYSSGVRSLPLPVPVPLLLRILLWFHNKNAKVFVRCCFSVRTQSGHTIIQYLHPCSKVIGNFFAMPRSGI